MSEKEITINLPFLHYQLISKCDLKRVFSDEYSYIFFSPLARLKTMRISNSIPFNKDVLYVELME